MAIALLWLSKIGGVLYVAEKVVVAVVAALKGGPGGVE